MNESRNNPPSFERDEMRDRNMIGTGTANGSAGNDVARRWFLSRCGVGLGAIALADLLGEKNVSADDVSERGSALANGPSAARDPLAARPSHFPAKIKHVIYLFMAGGPSQFETFDHKPTLAKYDGTLPPAELLEGYRAAFINPNSKLLGPKFKFTKHGKSGAEISELLPHIAGVADDLAIIRSMRTDAFNHAPGQLEMNTGSQLVG